MVKADPFDVCVLQIKRITNQPIPEECHYIKLENYCTFRRFELLQFRGVY